MRLFDLFNQQWRDMAAALANRRSESIDALMPDIEDMTPYPNYLGSRGSTLRYEADITTALEAKARMVYNNPIYRFTSQAYTYVARTGQQLTPQTVGDAYKTFGDKAPGVKGALLRMGLSYLPQVRKVYTFINKGTGPIKAIHQHYTAATNTLELLTHVRTIQAAYQPQHQRYVEDAYQHPETAKLLDTLTQSINAIGPHKSAARTAQELNGRLNNAMEALDTNASEANKVRTLHHMQLISMAAIGAAHAHNHPENFNNILTETLGILQSERDTETSPQPASRRHLQPVIEYHAPTNPTDIPPAPGYGQRPPAPPGFDRWDPEESAEILH